MNVLATVCGIINAGSIVYLFLSARDESKRADRLLMDTIALRYRLIDKGLQIEAYRRALWSVIGALQGKTSAADALDEAARLLEDSVTTRDKGDA